MTVWWGSPVECAAAIARRWRENSVDRDAHTKALACCESLAADWIEIGASEEVRRLALRAVRVHELRAADALQLAAALLWVDGRPGTRGFVSFDVRLAEAAALEGFAVLPG